MSFKRNEDLVKRVNEILNNDNLDELTKATIQVLFNQYKEHTYNKWDDRHSFYREMVCDMVNDCGFQDDELAEQMANEHPTLQQNFMRLCRKFIVKMSQKTYYDGRNESSVKMAKKMVEAIKDDSCLPFI